MLTKKINKQVTAMMVGPLLGFAIGLYSITSGFDIPAGYNPVDNHLDSYLVGV